MLTIQAVLDRLQALFPATSVNVGYKAWAHCANGERWHKFEYGAWVGGPYEFITHAATLEGVLDNVERFAAGFKVEPPDETIDRLAAEIDTQPAAKEVQP